MDRWTGSRLILTGLSFVTPVYMDIDIWCSCGTSSGETSISSSTGINGGNMLEVIVVSVKGSRFHRIRIILEVLFGFTNP